MIKSNIKDSSKYYFCHPLFAEAFATMKKLSVEVPDSKTASASGVKCNVQSYSTKPASEKKIEAHKKYIDIQYVMSGEERIYFDNLSACVSKVPYDSEKDVEFYFAPKSGMSDSVVLRAGDFAIFFPEDAHQPGCDVVGTCAIKKVVMKIPVE